MIKAKIMWEDAHNLFERGDVIVLRGMGGLRILDVTNRGLTLRKASLFETVMFSVKGALRWVR
jgi:hypothetical protein